ncbi:Bro-N domain-containing protein [Pseudomonas corrugata]|uniref:BRO-N domain-containing protein n=1 Tax=Pseudomonas corrugata TaxID=47879 RepID=UPI0018E6264D|nr:Bro-N domain-containing protein [Pseudomonas corrugata]MBI6621177.1 Bro-N domain-containing protein [Pseudomonas corrugata]MBI6693743.1 Bro-N domain-containing protein [Pseudomonas corrugata]
MHSSINTGNTPANVATRFAGSENVSRIKSVTPFDFHGFPVRVIDEGNGEPWFIAKDIAEALGYSNTSKAINAHCKAVNTCHTEMGGQVRAVQIIPERDLYRLVMKSKLPAAEQFEEWVVGQVLPAIRKTGSYTAQETNNSKVIGELAILECFDRLLKPAPSSKMMMLAKIAANNGLDAKFLPGYAIDAAPDAAGGSSMPTKSATALLKDNGIRCAPAAFNTALAAHGFLKQLQRKNSKGEMVPFWSVTEKGLQYGKNLTSPQSPRETQPHWYVDRFLELAGLVGKGSK